MPRHFGIVITLLMLFAVTATVSGESASMVEGWQLMASSTAPPPRFDHALVAAPDFNRLVLFGGQDSARMNDTWIYEIGSGEWRQVAIDFAPPIRSGMGAAYDAMRGRVLIFGGEQPGVLNDTWAFDMATETWSEIPATGTIPEARYGTSGVVDAENDRFIISHGFAGVRFDNTYALDLTTNTWTDISPAARPPARCLHDAAYDPVNGKMILFGGCSSPAGPCPQGDLWSFDLLSGTWTELNPGDARPSARMYLALAADEAGTTWLFGGDMGSGSAGDFWSLDPLTGAWTQHEVLMGPSARSSHDAAWDSEHGLLWMFGGKDASGSLNDLWRYTPEDSVNLN